MFRKNNGRRRRLPQQWIAGYLFVLPNFLGFLIFSMIPALLGFVISFTNYDGYKTFDFVGLQNYVRMFSDEYFLVSLKNNVIYTCLSVPLTLVFSLLLAQMLNRKIPLEGFFKTVCYFPYITSMVAVGVVFQLLFNPRLGPINMFLRSIGVGTPPGWLTSTSWALYAVILVGVWKQTGYYMLLFLAGLKGIPKPLYESADIDGAGGIRQFFSITLPMLSPTTFLVSVLSIISSFQVFDLIAVMTDGGPGRATNVLVYRIYQEGFDYSRFGYASAMAYFLFMIILIVTLIQFRGQKNWVTYE